MALLSLRPTAGQLCLAVALALAGLGGCAETPAAPAAPQRIIAIAPSLVEILYALDLDDRVVGVGDYSAYPPQVLEKPRIGGLFDARLEQIVALSPDLALLLPSEADLGARLSALGVEVLTVPSESLADVENAVRAVGARAGVEERAARFLESWHAELEPAEVEGAPRVLLSLAREPGRVSGILVAGPETFLDELLDRLGARNVFADAPIRYPQVGAEELLGRQPDIIVELQPRAVDEDAAGRLRDDWRRIGGLAAADAGCVQVIGGEHTLLPGPRLPRLYAELADSLAVCAAAREAAVAP